MTTDSGTNQSLNIPGEISLKIFAITILAFVLFDLIAYFSFSRLFQHNSPESPAVILSKKVETLEDQIKKIELHLNTLDAGVKAAAAQADSTERSVSLKRTMFLTRAEFERLKRKLCSGQQPCDQVKPCKQ